MSILFEPAQIGRMSVPNRLVRSATYDGCTEKDGHVTQKQLRLFRDLASGGTGLLITGITYVHPLGQIAFFQNSLADDDCIPGLKELTHTVHQQGSRIAVQLFHAGREAAGLLERKDQQAVGPSVVEDDPYFSRPYREATEEDIQEIVSAFGEAARRAREAGFDAVQLHAAHAYLPAQFLSPHTNRRQDHWGGSLENRLRLHREIYRSMRDKAGPDFPILVKLGVADGFPGGLEEGEGLQAARMLAEEGFDALEISSGLRGKRYRETEFRTEILRPEQEAYFRHWCSRVKERVEVPVIMVGGLRSPELMEEILHKGEADLVSLSRPLIREPDLVRRWRRQQRDRPACISCNQCLEALFQGYSLHCPQLEGTRDS